MTNNVILFVLGLVLLIAVELLRWLAGMPAETCTALSSIAWLCVAGAPALAARAERAAAAKRSDESGRAGVGLLASLLTLALVPLLLALALGGCAWQARRDGDTFELRLREDPARAKPACLYRWTLDGELVLEGAVAECPAVPACMEVTP